MWKSLVARITMVSVGVMAFLLCIFMLANEYAISRLYDQAVAAQQSILELYTGQMNSTLENLRKDMLLRKQGDLDLNTLCLYDPSENDYKLSAQRCKLWMGQNLVINPIVSGQFIYDKETDMLLMTSREHSGERYLYIRENLDRFLEYVQPDHVQEWSHLNTKGFVDETESAGWLLLKSMHLNGRVYIGTIINVRDLIPALSGVMSYEDTHIRIYSSAGDLLAQSHPDSCKLEFEQSILENMSAAASSDYSITTDPESKEEYIVISRYLGNAGVYLVTLLPESSIQQELAYFRAISYVLVVLLVVIVVIFLMLLPKLYRPYEQLVSIIGGVGQGDFSLRLPEGKTPEFRLINSGFNDMIMRIDQLNQNVYLQTKRAHKAELMHLQAQINPHFYQNTLNIIYSLAVLKRYELIKRTALHLGDYFRFIMNSGDSLIFLKDELSHISHYMEIQKIRYPNQISYECHVADEALNSFPILPLLIQPFVENSIIHGYTKKHLFEIEVKASLSEESNLVVEVKDNGNGMPEDILDMLNRLVNEPSVQEGNHLGVLNVVMRLKHNYGDRAKLRFESNLSAGTYVYMEIPSVQKKEGES